MGEIQEVTRSYQVSDYTRAYFVQDHTGWVFERLDVAAPLDIDDFKTVSKNILEILEELNKVK